MYNYILLNTMTFWKRIGSNMQYYGFLKVESTSTYKFLDF